MLYSAKLLGFFTATALIIPAMQAPGVAQEPQPLSRQMRQTKQADETTTVLLEVEGVLEAGDDTLNDGSLYDTYTFDGNAGQTIAITLESVEFDTFLLILDNQGDELARNNDIDTEAGNYHSFITLTLPTDGIYTIWANGFDESSRGRYSLTVVDTSPEQAAPILSDASQANVEADRLLDIGLQQFRVSQFREALQSWQQVLDLYRKLGNRQGEANALGNLGLAYFSLGDYEQAIDVYEQRLAITSDLNNRQQEGQNLGKLGNVYFKLGDYQQALRYYEQYLAIARELDSLPDEVIALSSLVQTHIGLQNYQESILLAEEALAIIDEFLALVEDGQGLGGTQISEQDIEQLRQAESILERYIAIVQEIFAQAREGANLDDLNSVFPQYQQAAEAQHQRAIDLYQQRLVAVRQAGNRAEEGQLLGSLGDTHRLLGQPQRAINFYEQQLAVTRDIEDIAGEGDALSNLGRVLNDQGQPELAIIFLKALVQIRESIRDNIQGLDTEVQEAYTNTIADDYRLLADLLLEQGRIPEAQQVLDLLKLEELREFTETTRATWTGGDLQYTDPEQDVIDAHGSLVALGGEVIACEGSACAELDSLYDQLEALTAQYNQQVEEFEAAVRANRAEDEVFVDPDNLSGEAEELLNAYTQDGEQAVLIYPFVLEDKLWLVWAAAGNVIGSVEVPVSQGELASTVQRFGELLKTGNPGTLTELQATSQQLYDWIIRPLETELAANDIDHLIFVNDRVTRYIPMAALYDGEQYLLERYRISTVLAPGLTDTEDRLADIEQSQVLGLGLTQAVADFNPLPAVDAELDAIIRSDATDPAGIYPGQVFLNNDFTLDTLKAQVRGHRVLHLATHAAFVPGRAEESFILLGNGEPLKIDDIEAMHRRLSNLHLVVLSACQTALGGPAGDGTEIAGISSYFLEKGRAETVIASLWSVNDDSTSLLMQRFYELLASGELTKAEALRQAQLSLLYDEETETRLAASRASIVIESRDGQPLATTGLEHPYHWAPFILIGNGL
ncbi:Tetratricopeptide repeat domain protein [Halomicronema hongdechloris C2206]|uniref:Tetratricopeptide repeat domain protein n=1 Tax=Halomicronema hongdechloris C2206 TaxID=1641165 RepID=A0A1Z3HRZ4_9CYAN|nr:CHAT domain-containing protein [Halomicronema hongdechloris]ASC73065.1 Tetratricopeptide repeat domain protein [Halomicronema hongdechloris C2206]